MTFQPIDLPSLLRALLWPVITIITLAVFRQPLGDLVKILAQRIHKFSFGGFSLELVEVAAVTAQTLEAEILQLDPALISETGSSAISGLLMQFQTGRPKDYIVLNLGSESSPRWWTSRLYLLTLLLVLVDRQVCLVFVETVGSVRKRFIGTSSPDRTRWALARRYSWLESASAAAYATLGGAYCNANLLQLNQASSFQFDAVTGSLAEWHVTQLIKPFLASIQITLQPGPENKAVEVNEWLKMKDNTFEHAKWLNGERIERLLGSDLNVSSVVLLPNKNIDDLGDAVLRQQGRFVAVVDADQSFRCLVDRSATLEGLARGFVKQADSNKS